MISGVRERGGNEAAILRESVEITSRVYQEQGTGLYSLVYDHI